jgi:hypothetical protein
VGHRGRAVNRPAKGAGGDLGGCYEHLRLNGGAAAHWSRSFFGPALDRVRALYDSARTPHRRGQSINAGSLKPG